MEIRIEIPQHIRRVQISDSRRAIYFEWDNRIKTIRAQKRGLKIPRRFYKEKDFNKDKTVIEDLIDSYCLGVKLPGKDIVKYTRESSDLNDHKLPHNTKFLLCEFTDAFSKKLTPVIANLRTVGTPSWYLINGQDIFNGSIGEFKLSLVMNSIKDCFRPFVKEIEPIKDYPIQISLEIHDTIRNMYGPSNNEEGYRWDVDNYALPYCKAFPDLLYAEGKIKDDDRLHFPHNIHTDFVPIDEHAYRKLVFIIRKTERSEILDNKIYKEYHNKKDTGFMNLKDRRNDGTSNPIF